MPRGNGRDITLSLVTDLDRFDPDRAADGLDDLGRSADRAADDLRDIDQAADRAGDSLRHIGDGAADAGRRSSEAFDEMKETGKGAATEIGGSFDGTMDGIVGGVQGAAAEWGTAVGGMAGAAAVAGAMAIGAVFEGIKAKAERFNEQVQGVRESLRQMDEEGRSVASSSQLADWFDNLEQVDIDNLEDDAKKLGVSVQVLARALNGEEDAISRVTAAREKYERTLEAQGEEGWSRRFNEWAADTIPLAEQLNDGLTKIGMGSEFASEKTRNLTDANLEALEAEQTRQEILGGLTEQQNALNESLRETFAGITDASDDVEQAAASATDSVIKAAQEQADATQDMADTWADYAGNSAAAADEIIAEQERQLAKLTEFQANTQAVLQQGGEDLVAWANQQTDAPAAMAAAAQMTPEQGQRIADNYRKTVELAGEDMVKGTETALDATVRPAGKKGEAAGAAYADGVVKGIKAGQPKIDKAAKAAYPQAYNASWTGQPGKKVP